MAKKSKTDAGQDQGSGAMYHQNPEYELRLKKRSCTDVICLLIFIVFFLVWIALGIFAYRTGTPEEFFAPKDSNGNRCGYDDNVKDKPHLFFFDLQACVSINSNMFHCNTPQVCLKKCPSENFYAQYYINQQSDIDFVKTKLYCKDGVLETLTGWDRIQNAINQKNCSPWYLKSTSVAHRCLPERLKYPVNVEGDIVITVVDKTGNIVNTTIKSVNGSVLHDAAEAIQVLSGINEFGTAVVRDLSNNWPWIVLCIGIAMVVSFLYIVIMRWLAGPMTWLSIFACIGVLGYCSYATWIKYAELRDLDEPERNSRSDIFTEQWESFLQMKEAWLAFFILSIGALVIVLIMLIFLRSRIRLAIALINEGSKAVSHSMCALIFPIFPWLAQLGVIAYGVAICIYLIATGAPIYKVAYIGNDTTTTDCKCINDYKVDSLCQTDIFKELCPDSDDFACTFDRSKSEAYTVYFQLYNVFMFLWGLFFVSGMGQMILASTFATYYWTFNKNDLPFFMVADSVWTVFRYHLGTVAFGSFLLALCNWIRVLIELSYNYLEKYDNGFIKALKCCLSCFFWCLNKFLKFLNKNAYIMCAIHGKNFCLSARDAFSLLMRNIVRVFVLDKVTDFLFFLSKLMLTAAMGALSFYLFSKPLPNADDLLDPNMYQSQYYFVPIVFVCIGTYFIASLFFGVYSMAVSTLFLCFLQDSEKNEGSLEKPYFMSKELMKILGRKNKKLNKKKK